MKVAKAGKRSAKGLEEAEAKVEKMEHQQHRDEEAEAEAKPKAPVKPTRSRLERRGKGYRKSAELIEKGKAVSYTHLRAHETVLDIVCRLLLEKKNKYTHKRHF